MTTRRILYFTDEDHYLYRSARRTLELEAKFSGDDLGISAFREHLRGQRGALFAVLADLAGEDFHEEQVPFVRGADREALLARRLAPWLDALEEAGARLAGVYSIPLLAPALAAKLGVRDARVLLVTANRAGLRQCYVEQGKLRFARLERTVDMVPQALALFVRSETQRLVQYLVTLRALPRDGGAVQVLVVAPPGERAAFEQALSSDAR